MVRLGHVSSTPWSNDYDTGDLAHPLPNSYEVAMVSSDHLSSIPWSSDYATGDPAQPLPNSYKRPIASSGQLSGKPWSKDYATGEPAQPYNLYDLPHFTFNDSSSDSRPRVAIKDYEGHNTYDVPYFDSSDTRDNAHPREASANKEQRSADYKTAGQQTFFNPRRVAGGAPPNPSKFDSFSML